MSADFKMTFNADGTESNTSLDEAMRQDTPATPTQTKQVAKMRGRFDESTGEFVVEENRPTQYRAAPVESQGITVRSNAGPTTLAQARPDSIVNLPGGMGETSCAAAVTMGYLTPLPGGGYAPTALAQPQQPQVGQQTEQKPAEKKQDEPAGDVTGVEPTSKESDATLKTLASDEPMALEGLITSLSLTGDVNPAIIADIARQRGVEESVVQAQVSSMVQDHVRAAQQAIARVDSTIDPVQFQAWLLKSPDLADTVTRDIMNHSVASVQSAARAYLKNRDTALESALVGRGIATTRIEGKLYMSRKALGLAPKPKMGDFPASDWIAVDQAVRDGHLTING